jgi:2-polyprenyl-3-methyl-5-hydroxy-6-metoxy-1,4-benzoquinol methylase
MKSHLDHLADSFPSVLNGKVLDIGAGRGRFLIDVARREGKAIGIELNQQNIEIAKRSAFEAGVTIDIRKGVAEKINPILSN